MEEKKEHAREDLIYSLRHMVDWINGLPFEAGMAPVTHRDLAAFVITIIEIFECSDE